MFDSTSPYYVDLGALVVTATPADFNCKVIKTERPVTPFYICSGIPKNWAGTVEFKLPEAGPADSMAILLPDGSVKETGVLHFASGLNTASHRQYNIELLVSH